MIQGDNPVYFINLNTSKVEQFKKILFEDRKPTF